MKTKHTLVTLTALSLLASCAPNRVVKKKNVPPEKVAEVAHNYGTKALAEKRAKKAINFFSTCLKFQPEHKDCHRDIGWAYFMDHQFDKAQMHWETRQLMKPKATGLSEAIAKVKAHTELYAKAMSLKKLAPLTLEKGRMPASDASSTVSIRAVGDVMLGTDASPNMLPPSGKSPLGYIEKTLSDADVTFANYEGTFCDNAKAVSKCEGKGKNCFAFRTPTKLAPYLKDAGIDVVSLANNHIMDFGEECRTQTEKTLDNLGISWSGKVGTVARFEKKNQKFSMIAFHSADHTNSIYKIKTATKLIKEEKKAGRIVIVSFHGGAEGLKALNTPINKEIFMGENRGEVVNFAHSMVDAGADLIVGSGPHVVRGMEIYKDRLIAYSLGNFSTYKAFDLWGVNSAGVVLDATLDNTGRFVSGKVIPTKQLQYGYPVVDKKMTSTDLIRLLSGQDFPTSGIGLAQDGSILRQPLIERKVSSTK